jgi:hypothetical protein
MHKKLNKTLSALGYSVVNKAIAGDKKARKILNRHKKPIDPAKHRRMLLKDPEFGPAIQHPTLNHTRD